MGAGIMSEEIKPNSKLRIEAEHLAKFTSMAVLSANGTPTGQQWNFTDPVTITFKEDHDNGLYTVQAQEDGSIPHTFNISELDFLLLDAIANNLGIGFEADDNNVSAELSNQNDGLGDFEVRYMGAMAGYTISNGVETVGFGRLSGLNDPSFEVLGFSEEQMQRIGELEFGQSFIAELPAEAIDVLQGRRDEFAQDLKAAELQDSIDALHEAVAALDTSNGLTITRLKGMNIMIADYAGNQVQTSQLFVAGALDHVGYDGIAALDNLGSDVGSQLNIEPVDQSFDRGSLEADNVDNRYAHLPQGDDGLVNVAWDGSSTSIDVAGISLAGDEVPGMVIADGFSDVVMAADAVARHGSSPVVEIKPDAPAHGQDIEVAVDANAPAFGSSMA